MKHKEPIHIVGGGFSGLIQAYYLIEAGYSVTLYEKEERVGGLVRSQFHHDFLVESAANAFIANKELEIISDKIGVKLLPIKPAAKKRYIFRNGELRRWPLSFLESLPLLKLLFQVRVLKKIPLPDKSENLHVWGERHLGQGATDYLLEPAMRGVFALPSKQLSAERIFQALWPSPSKGKLRGSVAPREGMGEWAERLRMYLKDKGCRFVLGDEIESPQELPRLIVAAGLAQLKRWHNSQKLKGLPQSLAQTQLASLSSVVLMFKKNLSRKDGFGCLFPAKEKFHALGVLFNHNIFPGRTGGGHSETWILGDQETRFSEMSEEALLRYVLSDRAHLFSKTDEPDNVVVNQWSERIPAYDQNLSQFLQDLEASPPPFLLMGNYLGQLGLSRLFTVAQENVRKIQEGFYE